MLQSIVRFGSAALIGLGLAFAACGDANAESVMKQCGADWQAAKAAGSTNGQTWQEFLKSCRVQHQEDTQAPAAPASQAAPAPTPASTTAQTLAAGKTPKECNAEYAANKVAIKGAGQKKADFIAACRAGTETIPATAAAPAPAPAPTAAPTPAPMAPTTTAAPTGAGQFAAEQQAKNRCPTDTVVWVNTDSGVYHFAQAHNYGHTKQGAYMCEADAKAAGDRAAKNEKHP